MLPLARSSAEPYMNTCRLAPASVSCSTACLPHPLLQEQHAPAAVVARLQAYRSDIIRLSLDIKQTQPSLHTCNATVTMALLVPPHAACRQPFSAACEVQDCSRRPYVHVHVRQAGMPAVCMQCTSKQASAPGEHQLAKAMLPGPRDPPSTCSPWWTSQGCLLACICRPPRPARTTPRPQRRP